MLSSRRQPIALALTVVLIILFAILATPNAKRRGNAPGETIKLPDGTKVNNVEEVGPKGDALIATVRGEYQIEYVKDYNEFVILIYGNDFEAARKTAEDAFVTHVHNGSRKNACESTVRIIAGPKSYPERANTAYPLSFCAS